MTRVSEEQPAGAGAAALFNQFFFLKNEIQYNLKHIMSLEIICKSAIHQ